MMKRGRQSAAELSVVPIIDAGMTRLDPPSHLSSVERKLFCEIVDSVHPNHFTPVDVHLLCTFVQVTLIARSSVKGLPKSVAIWDRAVKLQATLATRLRISPQSRLDKKSVKLLGPRARPWHE